jgi:protein O-mannosyl-transferase
MAQRVTRAVLETDRGSSPKGEPPSDSPWMRRGPLIAAAVGFLVYLPSIAGPFLYDDMQTVIDNRSIRSLGTAQALVTVLRYDRARPLLNLTWALNHVVSGLDPWSYHLVNILVHAGNAALLASLFLWIAARSGLPRPRQTALLGACLFAANPMAVETIAYISSRSSALSTLFGLASLRLGVEALETRRRRHVAASIACMALALATKEEAAAVPLLLLLLDFFFLSDRNLRPLRGRAGLHCGTFGLLLLGLVARHWSTGSWLPVGDMGRLRYAVLEWAAFPGYLVRQILPISPAVFRGYGAPWPPAAGTYALMAATAALLIAAFGLRRRWPIGSFAIAWLWCALLPSSSLVPLSEIAVDHRAYLGAAGVAFGLAVLVMRAGRPAVATAVVLLFAIGALRYEWVLGDPVRAWEDADRRFPRSGALRMLAEAYQGAGDAPAAETAFLTLLADNPRDGRMWTNLGILYAHTGRYADALLALQQAAPLVRPQEVSQVQDNLGMILRRLGREDEAMAAFEIAVAADPFRVQPRINLAEILLKRGDRPRARALIEEAAHAPEITAEEAEWVERFRREP